MMQHFQEAAKRKLAAGAKAMMAPVLDTWARQELRLEPIAATESEDVFLVGFPKSGITWLQTLLAGLFYRIDLTGIHDTLVQDLIPDVEDRPYYRRYRDPMFFKSSHLPQPQYRRVIYLLRDGRDAVVSQWRHLEATQNAAPSLAQIITQPDPVFGLWHQHVDAWLTNPHQARMLVVKYEDLLCGTPAQLQRILQFVGEPRTAGEIALAVDRASFANMWARERRFGWDDPSWPQDHDFVRRGIAGSYRDEMPADMLELFMDVAGPTLRRAGYPVADLGFGI